MTYRVVPVSDHLQDGIIFFNDGRYFEAHEAWEDLWRETRGPLRLFYQGLVQAAVGLHHLSQGNRNGASAQLEKALSKLEQYPDRFCQIQTGKLVSDLRFILLAMSPQPVRIERTCK
jgi:predicted metal-dependent hydrolase